MKLLAQRLTSNIPVISLIISIVVAWLIFPPVTGFPMVAFFIFFVGLSSLVYFVRKNITWFDTLLYIGILLFSFFTLYRANEFLQFLNFISIIFFGSLLVRPLIHEQNIFALVFTPLFVIKDTFIAKNIFPYVFKVPEKYVKPAFFRDYLPTLIVTVLVLSITIPLLASANPFFNQLLQTITNAFNLDWLFRFLFADSFAVYVFRWIALLFFAFFIPRVLTIAVQGFNAPVSRQLFSVDYVIPKAAMAGLLIVFFITQLQLYFASSETLQNLGYTNSRLTNEVFAQVTIVAFIVFLLTYLDKSRKEWNTKLTYFLIVEAFFLVGIAFKSVYDYTALYGFTQKRLWGFTTMTWLTAALAAYSYHYFKQTPDLRFVKQALTYAIGVLLLVNILNFDYMIYHYAKPTLPGGVDYKYIAGLSADGRYYKEVLKKAMPIAEKGNFLDYDTTAPVMSILDRIQFLRMKYEQRKDINSFNFTEYQEYLDTKDIDVQAYREKILNTQQKHMPQQ